MKNAAKPYVKYDRAANTQMRRMILSTQRQEQSIQAPDEQSSQTISRIDNEIAIAANRRVSNEVSEGFNQQKQMQVISMVDTKYYSQLHDATRSQDLTVGVAEKVVSENYDTNRDTALYMANGVLEQEMNNDIIDSDHRSMAATEIDRRTETVDRLVNKVGEKMVKDVKSGEISKREDGMLVRKSEGGETPYERQNRELKAKGQTIGSVARGREEKLTIGGGGTGECCIENQYGGGGCGPCNRGASLSRIRTVYSVLGC